MSMLNVCTTDTVSRRSKTQGYRQTHRWISADGSGSYYSAPSVTSKNSSIEALFSRILDALIFTSAIAITAYTYVTGALIHQQSPKAITNSSSAIPIEQPLPNTSSAYNYQHDCRSRSSSSGSRQKIKRKIKNEASHLSHTQHQYHHEHHQRQLTHPYAYDVTYHHPSTYQQSDVYPVTVDETKKKRTQEWAEDQLITHPMVSLASSRTLPLSNAYYKDKRSLSTSSLKVRPLPSTSAPSTDNIHNTAMKREERKRRTRSLPVTKLEKEDELLSKVQSLIQQGQQALIS